MKRFECIIAPVESPMAEQTVIIEAKDAAEALTKNFEERPGTFVKSHREI